MEPAVKVIALGLNVPDLDAGGWRSPTACKAYPGSGWAPLLAGRFKDFRVMSGSEALAALAKGTIRHRDVYVVQEELNIQAIALINEGCNPFLLFCLESPLFAPFFYDQLGTLIKTFPFQILFQQGTHKVYFPSFDWDEPAMTPVPFEKRIKICAVISNKHYAPYSTMFGHSAHWNEACKAQLHDYRYAVISALKQAKDGDQFHLYGKGWPDGFGNEIVAGEKINVISRYKLNFCPENIVMRGYVTEKIIDSLRAGTIPVYSGAPDIYDYVPKEAVIFGEVPNDILETEKRFNETLAAGQAFIRSDAAKKFTYQAFANRIVKLFRKMTE